MTTKIWKKWEWKFIKILKRTDISLHRERGSLMLFIPIDHSEDTTATILHIIID